MFSTRNQPLKLALAAAAALALACGTSVDHEDVLSETSVGEIESEIRQALKFSEFSDPAGVGTRAQTPTHAVIRSAAAYNMYFGHAAPAEVDFAAGDVVIFYAAGVQNTGGHDAKVVSVSTGPFRRTLFVTTVLSKPGKGCMVTQALTTPYTLVKVRTTRVPVNAVFTKGTVVRDCDKFNPCALVKCAAGYHCEPKQVQCITTPCNPVGVCVKDPPTNPPPAGCAATLCPVGTQCVETPVQCLVAPCPVQVECQPVPGGTFCGGIAGIPCPLGQTCVDNPADSCDPKNGGADCGGLCKPAPLGAQCGNVTCGAGLFCCNASCGMCTAKGMACIQVACGNPP